MQIKAQDIALLASPADLIFDALREAITDGSLAEGAVLRQDKYRQDVQRQPHSRAGGPDAAGGTGADHHPALSRLGRGLALPLTRSRKSSSSDPDRARGGSAFGPIRHPGVAGTGERLLPAFRQRGGPQELGYAQPSISLHAVSGLQRPYYLQVVNSALDRIERYQRLQLTLTNGMIAPGGSTRGCWMPAWPEMRTARWS